MDQSGTFCELENNMTAIGRLTARVPREYFVCAIVQWCAADNHPFRRAN